MIFIQLYCICNVNLHCSHVKISKYIFTKSNNTEFFLLDFKDLGANAFKTLMYNVGKP